MLVCPNQRVIITLKKSPHNIKCNILHENTTQEANYSKQTTKAQSKQQIGNPNDSAEFNSGSPASRGFKFLRMKNKSILGILSFDGERNERRTYRVINFLFNTKKKKKKKRQKKEILNAVT